MSVDVEVVATDINRRLVILGPGGAGKSTLARQVGEVLDVAVIHLDPLYWKPGLVETPWPEIVQLARKLAEETPAWVIEGSGAEGAVTAADTLIFLDLPRWRYMSRFAKRWLAWRIRRWSPPSPDRPPFGESLRPDILKWFWTWSSHERPRVISLIENARRNRKQIVWLRTPDEVQHYLMSLRDRQVA